MSLSRTSTLAPNGPSSSSWDLLSSHHLFPRAWQFEPLSSIYHDPKTGVKYKWSSREHRKGIPAQPVGEGDEEDLKKEGQQWKVERGRTRWIGADFGDISWWVSILFTVGSVFWCINGILFFVYFTNDSPAFLNTEAATAFLGGSLFLVGAYAAWVESINPVERKEFDYQVDWEKRKLKGINDPTTQTPLGVKRRHFHRHLPSQPTSHTGHPFKYFGSPTTPSLSYIANSIQLFGATTFFVSVLCGLPSVLSPTGTGPQSEREWIGAYWAMQIIGAPCFVISGSLACIEVQEKWWKPALDKLGWHIGIWNVIGGFGFWFCGIFGIFSVTSLSNPELYQKWGTGFSTFWGSWAFLIGSYLQHWEGVNKRS